MKPLPWRTATELAEGFAAGRSRPSAVLEALLARSAALDETLGLWNDRVDVPALQAAATASDQRWAEGRARSPLDGVPFAVKANIAIRRLPWHGGIAAYRERIAEADAEVVATLRAAGLIPLGTLNMHEAALGETSQNPAFRNTRNPFDSERIPGGSSGGSAAAVAAGCVPLALGTDNMGSVRLPSALCGVVGHKPAHGVLSVEGVIPLCPTLDHLGVHARGVEDVQAIMTLFSGETAESHASVLAQERIGRLQLPDAYTLPQPFAVKLETHLAARGLPANSRRWIDLDWRSVDFPRERRAGLLRCERDAATVHAGALRENSEGFSETLRSLLAFGTDQSLEKAAEADARLAAAADRLRTALTHCDLLLLPTTLAVAPLASEPPPLTLADLTANAAFAGLPAVSVPLGFVSLNGSRPLPVGLQLIAAEEASLLAAAAWLSAPFEQPELDDA